MSPALEEKIAILARLEDDGPRWWIPAFDRELYEHDREYAEWVDYAFEQAEDDADRLLSWLGDLEAHEVG